MCFTSSLTESCFLYTISRARNAANPLKSRSNAAGHFCLGSFGVTGRDPDILDFSCSVSQQRSTIDQCIKGWLSSSAAEILLFSGAMRCVLLVLLRFCHKVAIERNVEDVVLRL